MDFRQRRRDGLVKALRTLAALLCCLGSLAGVEVRSAHRIRESRYRPAVVDAGLRPLGLQLAKNLGQLRDLGLLELQPMRQKPQRTPDAKRAAVIRVAIGLSVPLAAPAHLGTASATCGLATGRTRVSPPWNESCVHCLLLSRGLFAPGGVYATSGHHASPGQVAEKRGAFQSPATHKPKRRSRLVNLG